MQRQISIITLGVRDLVQSRRFYAEGFGWGPVFENEGIIFYQMNGFVLGTFLKSSLEEHIGPFFSDVFPFDGKRCERLTNAVVARLARSDPGTFIA